MDESLTNIIDEETQSILMGFLEKKKRTGSETTKIYYSAIRRFLEFVNISSIREITYEDSTKYFTFLDRNTKNYKMNYKVNQMRYCRSFFEYAEHVFQTKRISFFNPVPKVKYFNFTPDEKLTIVELESKQQDQFYTLEQLREILEKTQNVDYEKYIQVVLLVFCGMRGSEVVSIRKDNVKVYNRFLLTGMEENARKSSKNSDGIYFCFPKEVAVVLADYMLYHNNKYPNSEWMFPSHKDINKHQRIRGLQAILSNMNFNFNVRTHKFRKTLSTYRQEIDGVKTPTYVLETLSNHAISSIEHKHYAQYSIKNRLSDYDRYLPTEYKKLIKIMWG